MTKIRRFENENMNLELVGEITVVDAITIRTIFTMPSSDKNATNFSFNDVRFWLKIFQCYCSNLFIHDAKELTQKFVTYLALDGIAKMGWIFASSWILGWFTIFYLSYLYLYKI